MLKKSLMGEVDKFIEENRGRIGTTNPKLIEKYSKDSINKMQVILPNLLNNVASKLPNVIDDLGKNIPNKLLDSIQQFNNELKSGVFPSSGLNESILNLNKTLESVTGSGISNIKNSLNVITEITGQLNKVGDLSNIRDNFTNLIPRELQQVSDISNITNGIINNVRDMIGDRFGNNMGNFINDLQSNLNIPNLGNIGQDFLDRIKNNVGEVIGSFDKLVGGG